MLRRIQTCHAKSRGKRNVSDTGNGTYKGPGVGRSMARVEVARGSQHEMRSERDWAHEITDGTLSLTWEFGNQVSSLKWLSNPAPVPEPSYRSIS